MNVERFCDCGHPDCHVCKIWDAYEKERDELAAQVEVMRDALDELEGYARNFSVSGVYLSEEIEGRRLLDKAVDASTITGPAALREIQAMTLVHAAEWFDSESYTERDESGAVINFTEDRLRAMAAAIRKGEE